MSEVVKFNDDTTAEKIPDASPRKGAGKMSKADIQRVMKGLVEDAVDMVDGELSPRREKATDYYFARPFGNEEDGRSQVVISEVRDSVHGALPGLLRVFTGPERVVEFVPRTEAKVEQAAQATDYVQYVVMEDNNGFLKLHDVLKDGMVRKLGVVKWYWDYESKRAYREEGISDEELNELAARDDVEVTDVEDIDPEPGSEAAELNKEAQDEYLAALKQYNQARMAASKQAAQPPQPGQPPQPAPQLPPRPTKPDPKQAHNVEYTVTIEGKPCVVSVPPEEFLFNRNARTLDDAIFVAHRVEKTRGELAAMGIPEDVLEEFGIPGDASLEMNSEAVTRSQMQVSVSPGMEPQAGEANDRILYVEAYPYLDLNGDGDRELCKVVMIGPTYHVAMPPEVVEERPFALFCPIPEPHTLIGQSDADLTMDLQLIKSSISRSMLDSLALALTPRMTVLEGMANLEDVMNNELANPIRIRKDGAVQPFNHTFVGEAALPVLQYFDEVTENRTQRSKGAMGLDADALQSSTAQAVNSAVQSAQQGLELIARIFAEQLLKPLFRGMYRMLVKYRPAARLVRLRGRYVQIDTQTWDADCDVAVNVALGTTNVEKKLAALAGIAEKIEQQIAQFGPAGPATGLPQLIEVYRRMTELSGIHDPTAFFKPLPPDWQPPQPPAPPPSPEQVLAQANLQIEQIKAQKELKIKQAELRLKMQAQAFDQELAVRKLANDFVLRRYAINAQFKSTNTQQQLEADARSEEAELDGTLALHDQLHQHAMDRRSAAFTEAQAALAGDGTDEGTTGDDTGDTAS